MEYKVVTNPHVVPRGYLRGFAEGELIAMRLVGRPTPGLVIPVAKAGVLKDFYVRHRPADGKAIYDADWMLDHIDKAAPPILRGIVERWPLPLPDRLALGEFVALQMLRGPRWRAWHLGFNDKFFAELDRAGLAKRAPDDIVDLDEQIDAEEQRQRSNSSVILKMFEFYPKAAQAFGSMHWTLVEFKRPWLATSDHPVFFWPLTARSRQPKKSKDFLEGGLVNTLEVRFPISCAHALLMTWLDAPNERSDIVRGDKEIAANINALTVAEAENQWFHLPGATAPRASGQLLPIAPRLLTGYDAEVAFGSARRTITERMINAKVGKGGLGKGYEVLAITPDGRIEIVRVGPAPARPDGPEGHALRGSSTVT